jgi:hypothetical protein
MEVSLYSGLVEGCAFPDVFNAVFDTLAVHPFFVK